MKPAEASIPTLHKKKHTPAQKWSQAVNLQRMAWNLKCASIRRAHPIWSEDSVQAAVKEIFLNATT